MIIDLALGLSSRYNCYQQLSEMALEESAMVWISDIAARISDIDTINYKASDDTDEAAYDSEIATGKFIMTDIKSRM